MPQRNRSKYHQFIAQLPQKSHFGLLKRNQSINLDKTLLYTILFITTTLTLYHNGCHSKLLSSSPNLPQVWTRVVGQPLLFLFGHSELQRELDSSVLDIQETPSMPFGNHSNSMSVFPDLSDPGDHGSFRWCQSLSTLESSAPLFISGALARATSIFFTYLPIHEHKKYETQKK